LLAILVPTLSTFVGTLFLGGILLASGVVRVIQAFEDWGDVSSGWELLTALLAIVAGAIIVLFPGVGMLTMTTILGSFFLVGGVVKFIRGLQLRDLPRWGWLCFSGVITGVLGALLLAHLPGSATWAVGTIIGIDLVVEGGALLGGTPRLPELGAFWRRQIGAPRSPH
jgi:uncharacterized membrane protein HdeD (DUF308 family)